MKKLILLIVIVLGLQSVQAQVNNFVPYRSNVRYLGMGSDSSFYLPVRDTNFIPFNLGFVTIRPQDSLLYVGIKTTAGGKQWDLFSTRLGIIAIDTAGHWLTDMYKKSGTDSVFKVVGGTHTFAFTVGSGSGGSVDLSGIRDTLGKKLDTNAAVKIDTAGKATGKIPKWDATCGCFKMAVDSVGAGGSGSGAFSALGPFRPGDENAPSVGDSILKHTDFSGKYLTLIRKGLFQEHVFNDTGWQRMTDTTIKVIPYMAADDWFYIEARDSSAYTQLTLQASSTPPSTTIAYVGATDGGNNGGSGTTRTFSVTVSSGTNRILLVGIVGDVVAGADDISSVTYAGNAMTFINKTSDGNRRQYLYYILNPTTSTNNVVVTAASSHWLMAGAIEYTGVQGIDVNVAENATGVSTKTTTVTTTTNNNWNVIFAQSQGYTANAGSGSTKRTPVAVNGYWTWFDSGAAITPAGSYSMTTSLSTGANIGHCLVSLKPY